MKPSIEGREFQRFILIRPLGSGGFGAVYEAVDVATDQHVALKELTNISPNTLLRFKQEFRALSGVHHPNLVSMRELIEQEGRWYIVMELVEGKDLVQFVRFDDDSGFHEDRLRQAFLGVAQGLIGLHAHGILHRDLKPSNVRVTPEGRAVLLDFGLATSVDSAGQSTHAAGVGTLLYMAPEQFEGRKLTPAADWYAFGTCLYEALTGQFPYDSNLPAMIAAEKTRKEAAHPRTLVPELPMDLAELCHALLRIAPDQRPTVRQVLHTFQGRAPRESAEDGLLPDTARERVFEGREAELGHLGLAQSRTDEGAMRIVLVEGESGVGKSELVAEFLRRQQAREPLTLTLRARCYENERVSYKAFDGCVDELAQVLRRMGTSAEALMPADASLLAQLFPVLGGVPAIARSARGKAAADPTARRLQAFAAFAALLSRLSEERPVVLAIDDLQWADEESFRLMRALVEDARRPPVLVLATIRPRNELDPDVRAQVEAVRALQCVDVVPITGLPLAQAAQLARILLGPSADAKWAGMIAEESRGHPLFLSELIQFSKSRDRGAPGTLTLDAALGARIERLPKQARALLELVAAAGRPHGTNFFSQALGGAKVDESVSVLLGAKLLRTRQQELACFHDRIRHVAVAMIPSTRLPHLHKQLAAALEADPLSDPTELANHWDQAEEAERACRAYEDAAQRALASLAFVQAERLYARALELAGEERDRRYTRLTIGRANAAGYAGHSAEAAALYQRAAQLNTSDEERLKLRSKTAQHLMLSGDVHTGLAVCRQLLSELGISLPSSDIGGLLRGLWDRFWLYLRGYELRRERQSSSDARGQLVLELLNDLMKAVAILRTSAYLALSGQHARRALALGNRAHTAAALANEAWLQNATGRRALAARLFGRARELIEQTGDPAVKALLKQQEGSANASNWDWVKGSALLQEAEELYKGHVAQDPWSLTVTRYILGAVWYRLGEHAPLAAKMDLWIGEARERHDRVGLALLSGMGHGFTRHLMRRNPEEALRELNDAIAAVPAEPFAFAHLGHMIGAQTARVLLDARVAHQWFELNEKQLRQPLLLRTRFARDTVRMLRAMAALRACEGASESARKDLLSEVRLHAAALARGEPGFTHSHALHSLAQVAALEGDQAEALRLTRVARQGFEQFHYIGAHASLYLEALIAGGQDAHQQRATALNVFRSRGWIDPQQALVLMVPALPALVQGKAARKVAQKKLIHQYEVLAPLGSGGFGTVFEARDVQSGRAVALKELVSGSARSLERFKREFRALSNLHHPNLVRFDALFEHQGTWYIAMELVRGQDLISYVRPGGELDHARLRQAFTGLLVGISALHEAGFIHRDITPENVCVDDEGRAVLLDFGLIARAHDAGDADSVGNDNYAPPEQLDGATPHTSADVYGLGACLFHALSGRMPFETETPSALGALKRAHKLRPVSVPKLRALSECATRMLTPHPAARPTLAEVHELLSGAQGTPSRPPELSVVPEPAHASSFQGRRSELAELGSAFDRAREGFQLLLVEGESGLGKSALVAEFARACEEAEDAALVLGSRCYENERVALKAFDGMVDQLARRLRALPPARCEELLPRKAALLAQLFPVLGTVPSIAKAPKKGLPADPSARRALALTCLSELLERLSAAKRLLLWIDDLQWADVESLRLLHTLAQRAERLPLLVVCTLRPREEIAPELLPEMDVLHALEATHALPLSELSQTDREQLSAALLGPSPDPALLMRLSEESKGHPLFLRELAAHARSGAVHTSSGLFSLDDALRARIARFDPEAQRLLALLALAGRPYSTQVFANALGRRELPLKSLTELLNQGLVRRRGEDALTCYHDRIRHVATAALSASERRELSAKLAAALEALPSCEPAQRARLWDEADQREQAIPALEAAGDAALEKLAFEAAEEHYARALTLLEPARDGRWRRLMMQRGHALVRMGKYARAAGMFAAAAEGAEGELGVRLRVWAAQNSIQGAQVAEGLRAASQLLSELGVPLASSEQRAVGRVMWESARLKLRGIELRSNASPVTSRERLVLDALNELSQPVASVMFLRGAALSAQYVRRALAAGEPAHAARALAYEGMLRSTRKPQQDHSALFARARELARSTDDPAVLASVEVRSGIAWLARDRYAEARDALLRAHELVSLHCPGQPWLLNTARLQLGVAWYVLAEHATLAAQSEAWIADARQREDLYAYAAITTYGFGFLRHLMRDDPAAARAEIAEAMAPWPDEPFATHHFGSILATVYALSYQGGDAGLCWMQENEARFERAAILKNPVFTQTLYNLRVTASLAAMDGKGSERRAQLESTIAHQIVRLRRISSPLSAPFAMLWSSVLCALRGDLSTSFGQARRAREALSAVHKTYSIAALYWEGWLEAGASGAAKQAEALRALGAQGWRAPERALAMLLPVFHVLERPHAAEQASGAPL